MPVEHELSLTAMTRRSLLGATALAAGLGLCGPAAAMARGAGPLGRQGYARVVSIHQDAPYLDLTGRARPYIPAIATDWADDLDDEALARLGAY